MTSDYLRYSFLMYVADTVLGENNNEGERGGIDGKERNITITAMEWRKDLLSNKICSVRNGERRMKD